MRTEFLKKNWTLQPESFQSLLEWLDEGKSSDGERYLEIRRRLVLFFDRKNCLNPDDLADETLNRVARRITEEEKIETESAAKYCFIVAKYIFLESFRAKDKNSVPLEEVIKQPLFEDQTEEKFILDKRFDCLETCAEKLESANRELIFGYYYGEERIKINNRRELAKKFSLSTNALTIRACRIREKLQDCVKKCVEKD